MIIKIHELTFDLPEIYQYEDYRYAAECCCPECSKDYRYSEWLDHNTEGIVGYCVQSDGSYCLCLECPKCHTKYRYHYAVKWKDGIFDIEYWKYQVGFALYNQNEKTHEYDYLLK